MLNLSKDQGKTLPRIQSQKRVHTAFQRKQNSREAFDKKTQPNNRQLKRAFSTTNTCKAVKYENTGLMYTKKIVELENQNSELDKQLKRVEQEIKAAKKSAVADQKKSQITYKQPKSNFITEITDETQSKVSNFTTKNLTNEKTLNSELKLADNRLQIMRKKIDEQTQRNKKMRKQVDKVRKQINTLKQLNKNLQISLVKTNQQYTEFNLLSKKLDQEIAIKNNLMHKTKIQNQHKKAELIKQYNQILRCLDRQLAQENKKGEKSVKSENQVLYFTEYEHKSTAGTDLKSERNNRFSQVSLKKSKSGAATASQMSAIKSKLQRYQKQMDEVKKKTGTTNTEQIIKKFDSKYQQNFDFYKYINQLYATLEEKQKQKEQLEKQKQDLIEQISSKPSQVKNQQIQEITFKLQQTRNEKQKFTNFCQFYSNLVTELKEVIKQYFDKIYIEDNINKKQDISEQKIASYLAVISKRCLQLQNKFDQDLNWSNQMATSPQPDLNEMLEIVTKECNNDNFDPKSDKLMSRQQFLKARQIVFKKKQTPRRPLSKR